MDKNKEEFVKRIRKEYPVPKVIFVPAPMLVSKSAKEFKMYTEYLEAELNKTNKAVTKLKKDS